MKRGEKERRGTDGTGENISRDKFLVIALVTPNSTHSLASAFQCRTSDVLLTA